ncbi:MAG: hydroxymethylglutaryl-CoA synthase [Myxococcota bacterium]
MNTAGPGISAMSVYVPAYRVDLEQWCQWTDSPWPKIEAVTGRSFRMTGPDENVYTMAATAVLRLIEQYDLDPEQVGMLALGTESSTDNSAGAVIVRGMVDQRLEALGRPRLSRQCEVPEVKHACLGGLYALKSALRYVATDGADRIAIVVSADIAEYERGSSGEPTQGAGAVAMLVERSAEMLEVDLQRAGSASAYRGPDFRKPRARHFHQNYTHETRRPHDFPVFSGKYSTFAYLDETVAAVDDFARRSEASPERLFRDAAALFFHRPYRMMPLSATAFLAVRNHVREGREIDAISKICASIDVSVDQLREESELTPDLFARLNEGDISHPYPSTAAVASAFRKSDKFTEFVAEKMTLGAEVMMDVGNLYTAALPAWLAAGLEQAAAEGRDLTGETVLGIGYGSGDAAEAWPMRLVPGWEEAAQKIGAGRALEGAHDLSREQYEHLHDSGQLDYPRTTSGFFAIERVGERHEASFQDLGVEYYSFVG